MGALSCRRVRLLSGIARAALKLRAALCERSFALVLDRGGMNRAWLRGQENLHKALSTARRRLQSWPVDAADDRRRHPARAADPLAAFILAAPVKVSGGVDVPIRFGVCRGDTRKHASYENIGCIRLGVPLTLR